MIRVEHWIGDDGHEHAFFRAEEREKHLALMEGPARHCCTIEATTGEDCLRLYDAHLEALLADQSPPSIPSNRPI